MVGVFAFVLPRVADYGEVWDVVSGLERARHRRRCVAVAIVNLATFAPPWMAALPGLSFLHALVLSQASTAASSVLPGGDAVGIAISYSMLRRWGFTVEQVTVGSAATTVWNMFANVLFAVAAVGVLAIGGESHPLLTTAALVGSAARRRRRSRCSPWRSTTTATRASSAVSPSALWNGAARLLRRPPATGWDERLVGFRREAVGLLRRRWLALTRATLAGHLTVFLVLLVALRAVGVPSTDVSTPRCSRPGR